ncbi:unnamed protein product, partial [marine sediment metagenome]
PEGSIHRAWGGTRFQRYRYDPKTKKQEYLELHNQPRVIQNLWNKQHQYIKT